MAVSVDKQVNDNAAVEAELVLQEPTSLVYGRQLLPYQLERTRLSYVRRCVAIIDMVFELDNRIYKLTG